MDIVDIPFHKSAAALAALYNASRVQGMGFVLASSADMTEAEAAERLAESADKYVDYFKGRSIKIDFSGGQTSLRLFDRDNGPAGGGAAVLYAAGVIA